MKYCFLILNYIAVNETISCIKSIQNNYCAYDYYVVVVDNGSTNNSVQILKKFFIEDKRIYIISQNKNLGFAQGNNVGYRWCKEKLNPDFIIICNSDIIFQQKDFLKLTTEKYEYYKFDVMGPDIQRKISGDIVHQNPHALFLESGDDVINSIKENELVIFKLKNSILYRNKFIIINYFQYVKEGVKSTFPAIVSGFRRIKKNRSVTNNKWKTERLDCVLHGSCLIFSKKYIDKHEEAFYPFTFLYGEEKILYFLLKKENGIMLYTPDLMVIHKHGASTKLVNKNIVNNELFRRENSLKSLQILFSLINKQENTKE